MSRKGKASPQATQEERLLLAQKVCEVYQSQWCTVESACKSVGVEERTFRLWIAKYSEVSEMYKKAKSLSEESYFEDRLKPKAMRALEKLVDGLDYTEIKEEDGLGPQGPTSKTTKTQVKILPNPTSVIFAIKTIFPEKTRTNTDITSNGEKIGGSILDGLSVQDKAEILRILQKADAK